MSLILLGPYAVSIPRLKATARDALRRVTATLRADPPEALLARQSEGEQPGLYVIVEVPTTGAAALRGFWIRFGTSYLIEGAAGAPETSPPFASALLEALVDEVWWERLPVPAAARQRWTAPIVLEWSPALAVRASLPPPGEEVSEEPAEVPPPTPEVWPTPAADEQGAWLDDADGFFDPDAFQRPPAPRAEPSPAPAPPPLSVHPTHSRPNQRTLLTLIHATFERSRTLHRATYALIAPGRSGEGGAARPWSRWVLDGAAPAGRVTGQGGAISLPGDRLGFPLTGWLTRQLTLWPSLGDPATVGALPDRVVQSRLRGQAAQATTLMSTALLAVVGFSAIIRQISQPAPVSQARPVALAPQPALSVCSANHQRFVTELRCQVAAMVQEDGGVRVAPRCGDDVRGALPPADEPAPLELSADLQAEFCGLLHRDPERFPGRLRSSDQSTSFNWGHLAAAQACFNVLGQGETFELPSEAPRATAHLRVGDPRLLIEAPDLRVSPLAQLVDELTLACEQAREQMELVIEGRTVATLIGSSGAVATASEPAPSAPPPTEVSAAPQPRGRAVTREAQERTKILHWLKGRSTTREIALGDEPVALREMAMGYAIEGVPPDLQRCVTIAQEGLVADRRFETLCGSAEVSGEQEEAEASRDPFQSDAWRALGRQGATADSVIDRYAAARFGRAVSRVSGAAEDTDIWRCQQAMHARVPDRGVERGLWARPVPYPASWQVSGAGVIGQLDLDAMVGGIDAGLDLGACWSVARQRISGYKTVHPLLGELAQDGWPSETQRLCGQICAAYHRVQTPAEGQRWATPDSDLAACLRTSGPAHVEPDVGGFDRLGLPWNGPPRSGWQTPRPEAICAFNLAAQGYFPKGDEGFAGAGVTMRDWAGSTVEGGAVAGGANGLATASIASLYQIEPSAATREVCGFVATQCLTGLLLTVTADPYIERYDWRTRWIGLADYVHPLTAGEADGTVANFPWCHAIQPLFPPTTPGAGIESPCALGVAGAWSRVDQLAQAMASGALGEEKP